jgi:hypothetical protein
MQKLILKAHSAWMDKVRIRCDTIFSKEIHLMNGRIDGTTLSQDRPNNEGIVLNWYANQETIPIYT